MWASSAPASKIDLYAELRETRGQDDKRLLPGRSIALVQRCDGACVEQIVEIHDGSHVRRADAEHLHHAHVDLIQATAEQRSGLDELQRSDAGRAGREVATERGRDLGIRGDIRRRNLGAWNALQRAAHLQTPPWKRV